MSRDILIIGIVIAFIGAFLILVVPGFARYIIYLGLAIAFIAIVIYIFDRFFKP